MMEKCFIMDYNVINNCGNTVVVPYLKGIDTNPNSDISLMVLLGSVVPYLKGIDT